MQDSLNRDFFRMVEILNTRLNYETLLHENNIHVKQKLQKLDRNSAPEIIKHFSKTSYTNDASNACNMARYYLDILKHEPLEIV